MSGGIYESDIYNSGGGGGGGGFDDITDNVSNTASLLSGSYKVLINEKNKLLLLHLNATKSVSNGSYIDFIFPTSIKFETFIEEVLILGSGYTYQAGVKGYLISYGNPPQNKIRFNSLGSGSIICANMLVNYI